MEDNYLFEITSYYQGQTYTNRVFAPNERIAVEKLRRDWVKGVEITKVEQLAFAPAKTRTPKVY